MKFFLFLLFALPLAATVNEPWRIELFTGYRNDRLHWHLLEPGQGALTYRELYRDLEFWENGLTLKTIYRDLVFFLSGDYAAFGRGTLFQRYANLSFTSEEPNFQFPTCGWAADATSYFGYAANLTAGRTYKVIFIPLVGFSGHFEQVGGEGARSLTSDQAIGADSFTMQSSLPGKFHLSWYGVFLGGSFLIEPNAPLIFQAGYTYHWLRLRFTESFQNQVTLFTGNDVLSSQLTISSIKAKSGGNLGHTGWAQMDYRIGDFWRLGVGAQIHYFSSGLLAVQEKQQSLPSSVVTTIERKFKLRWTPISGWMQVSREF